MPNAIYLPGLAPPARGLAAGFAAPPARAALPERTCDEDCAGRFTAPRLVVWPARAPVLTLPAAPADRCVPVDGRLTPALPPERCPATLPADWPVGR